MKLRKRKQPSRTTRQSRRLNVELLEDRRVLALIYSTGFEDFSLGPISPTGSTAQNGWSGGAQGGFTNNDAGDEQIVNTIAHSGDQSWHYAQGYGSPGQGTPYGPIVEDGDGVNSDGDQFVASFWFRAATDTPDGQEIRITTGTANGTDRGNYLVYLSVEADGVRGRAFENGAAFDEIELFSNVSTTDWHHLDISLTKNGFDDQISVSLDNGAPVTFVGALNTWRDSMGFGYADHSRLKFAAALDGGSYQGFYFDDISYRVQPSQVWANDNWVVTTDVSPAGLSPGDVVANTGTGDDGTVTGKIFGLDAFSTIQDGVNAVATGGTVNVLAGPYNENVLVGKAVTLDGAGTGNTIVDQSGNIFTVTSSDVTLQDMTIQNGSQGIRVDLFSSGGTADNVEVNNVEFLNNSSRGIEIHNNTTVTDLRVLNSLFDGNGTGIRWASSAVGDGVLVDNSTFRNHTSELGIYQANGGSTGYVRDLTVTNSTFENNSFAAIFGEELREVEIADNMFEGNGRGFYLFKAYSTADVLAGDISIHDNEFTDHTAAAIEIWAGPFQAGHPGAQLDLPVTIEDNTISEDVGVLAVNWAQIDIRLKELDEETAPSPLTHAPVTVSNNSVTLSGTFTGGATAAHAVKLRGNVDGVSIGGNTMDGGDVGGAGAVGTEPPTSGIYVVADDDFWGSMSAGSAASIEGNGINGFVNGITSYDPDNGSVGPNLVISGNSIAGNSGIGVVAHAGNTLLENNNLNNNTEVGLLVESGAAVDAGQVAAGASDFTGLGISSGGNNFSSYNNTARTAYVDEGAAIRNLNAEPTAGPTATPPDVTAEDNAFFSVDVTEVEKVIDHDPDDNAKAYVDFQPLAVVIDNGDLAFSAPKFSGLGAGYVGALQGYQDDVHYHAPTAPGVATAKWKFNNVLPGTYQVAVTWNEHSNRAEDSPFTLSGTTNNGTVHLDQTQSPSSFAGAFPAAGVYWAPLDLGGNSGNFTVSGSTLTVSLGTTPQGYVIADAVRIELVAAAAPEIEVEDGNGDLIGGGIVLPTVQVSTPTAETITIKNLGSAPLNLGEITVSPDDKFSLDTTGTSSLLTPGQSTTFNVLLDTSGDGTFNATVSIPNDDSDENPLEFTVEGTVDPAPPLNTVTIIDNGDIGFSAPKFSGLGLGYVGAVQGYQGDIHYHAPATQGVAAATWTFDNLAPGTYQVAVTWNEHSSRAYDSPFTLGGTTNNGTVHVNQRLAPSSFADAISDDGVCWAPLNLAGNGGNFTVNGGTLTVTLATTPHGYVIADAVRIERLQSLLAEAAVVNGRQSVVSDQSSVISDRSSVVSNRWPDIGLGSPPAGSVRLLSAADVTGVFDTARAIWTAADPTATERLAGVTVQVADLPYGILGLASEHQGRIWLDADAAGHGWDVSGERRAESGEPHGSFTPSPTHPITPSSFDLLTALTHELGHILGRPDLDADLHSHDVMAGRLEAGVRRLAIDIEIASDSNSTLQPVRSPADRLFAGLGGLFTRDDRDPFSDVTHRQYDAMADANVRQPADGEMLPAAGRVFDDEEDLLADVADRQTARRDEESADQLFAELFGEIGLGVED